MSREREGEETEEAARGQNVRGEFQQVRDSRATRALALVLGVPPCATTLHHHQGRGQGPAKTDCECFEGVCRATGQERKGRKGGRKGRSGGLYMAAALEHFANGQMMVVVSCGGRVCLAGVVCSHECGCV